MPLFQAGKEDALWRRVQKENFRSLDQLADFLQLEFSDRKRLIASSGFVLNLPKRLACKIEKGTLDDPILRQFVPLGDEELEHSDFSFDPVGDQASRSASKLLHKYHGRALLLCTSACAMHCRYCFRRHFDYDRQKDFERELSLIASDRSLHEVILSGGDPLSLSNDKLANLVSALESIAHIKTLRFHSRFLIGIPERIDTAFLEMISNTRLQIVFVVHCNHPIELDADVARALGRLKAAGACLLNQAVLLKGVNDEVSILKELSYALFEAGVLPYYLHQLDRVQGAMHFEVAIDRGKQLIKALSAELPGYLLPRYVQELAGEPSKSLVS